MFLFPLHICIYIGVVKPMPQSSTPLGNKAGARPVRGDLTPDSTDLDDRFIFLFFVCGQFVGSLRLIVPILTTVASSQCVKRV